MKETAFLYFHISLFACSHNTRSPASDYIRCIRTRVFKMQTPDMLKIPESGLIHFLLYWLRYKKEEWLRYLLSQNSQKFRKILAAPLQT